MLAQNRDLKTVRRILLNSGLAASGGISIRTGHEFRSPGTVIGLCILARETYTGVDEVMIAGAFFI